MDRVHKPDFSTWSKQARRYALSLVEILNNDRNRVRLSEYTSILWQPVPQSTDSDQNDEIGTLRRGSIFALPAYGAEGLNALYELATMTVPHRSRSAVLCGPEALLHVALNRDVSFHIQDLHHYLEDAAYTSLVEDISNTHKNSELQREAHRQLSKIIYSFTSNPSDRHLIAHMIGMAAGGFLFPGNSNEKAPAINLMLEMVVQGALNISDSLCHQFEVLISNNLPEQAYQQFFEKCPALIDPLASSIVERQHMGEEWRSDFVIRRLDDQYIFVEIEKPQDSPCTSYPHPSAALSHALGQVLNWFAWVEDNIAYAQSHGFPGIHSPRGVVVIGRNSDLTASQLRLLKSLNDNLHPRIHIKTYDDVLVNARNIIRNLTAK
jgi:hypothetical protein